jgi:ABC-type enterochelin transport system permease subunit
MDPIFLLISINLTISFADSSSCGTKVISLEESTSMVLIKSLLFSGIILSNLLNISVKKNL